MKQIIIFLVLIALGLIATPNTYAQYNNSCPSIYGAKCPTGNLFIDKKVKNPTTGELVETLNANEANFLVGQEVNFRIEVKNTGGTELKNINVQDKFPSFITFISGPGNYNQASNTLNWTIANLRSGESQFFDIKVKTTGGKGLPDQGMSCLTNYAQASVEKLNAQDMSAFCIQTKVLTQIKELPQTGIKETVALFTFSLLTLCAGIVLFNKSKYTNL